jgi:hypothetical protein
MTKYCLDIQGASPKGGYKCKFCDRSILDKKRMILHSEKCVVMWREKVKKYKKKNIKLKQEIQDINEENEQTLKTLKDEFKQEKRNSRRKIRELEEQLAKEKLSSEIYKDVSKRSRKIINNTMYVNPKLLTITTDTIRPLTIETVHEDVKEGKFTQAMFENGVCGILDFVSNMIAITNENGEKERNYVCTDSSRHKFHRLVETREWKEDNGARFLNEILNTLIEPATEYYSNIIAQGQEMRQKYAHPDSDFDFEDIMKFSTEKVNSLKPIYFGIKYSKGSERDKLTNTLRAKIGRIAAV